MKGLVDRLLGSQCLRVRPNQATLQEYTPGQGIPPHIDTVSVSPVTPPNLPGHTAQPTWSHRPTCLVGSVRFYPPIRPNTARVPPLIRPQSS